MPDDLFIRNAAAIDELIIAWSPTIVPLYHKPDPLKEMIASFGTAVTLVHEGRFFLATALHVVQEMRNYDFTVGVMNGQSVLIRHLIFVYSKEHDVAVAELTPEWSAREKLESIKANPLIRNDDWVPIGQCPLIGFPASKNKIQPRYGELNRHLFSINATRCEPQQSGIKDGLWFSYDPKKAVNSQNINPGGKPPLHGMSGGPAYEVAINPVTQQTSLALSGILCEWKKAESAVVAAPLSAVADLITQLIEMRPLSRVA